VVAGPKPTALKVRAVTSWIMTSPDQLADTDRASLDAILAASPELAAVTASVRAFGVICREPDAQSPPPPADRIRRSELMVVDE
jgi:hypothetical protein